MCCFITVLQPCNGTTYTIFNPAFPSAGSSGHTALGFTMSDGQGPQGRCFVEKAKFTQNMHINFLSWQYWINFSLGQYWIKELRIVNDFQSCGIYIFSKFLLGYLYTVCNTNTIQNIVSRAKNSKKK